ncbi:MocR-like transcription factor YczR [Allostreptomyces psammosilenae]|uniref:DNA-binding transcriptional MocR family regulator n=1 Tax=Allostreptomyces psammosilenae TaxID=1892865 RepID=A0A852ZPU4_9ACTN|nr:PLP-dependent aminotransferase family protein [Allostreptomyces psammosilenae]NYI04413.1 DNA-binding transcriptional MocR family regulator [Allostreptomyces psammosilenae]
MSSPPSVLGTPRTSVGTAQLVRLLASRPNGRPAYRSLADALRTLVLDGRVPLAARLPAERELAAALSLSRTTVTAAYEALRAEGFLASRRGSGSWTTLPAGREVPSAGISPVDSCHGVPGGPDGAPRVIDLGIASLPAPEPWLSAAVAAAADELGGYLGSHGYFPMGLPVLREAVARRYTERGVPTTPDQILVSNGAAAGLSLVLGQLLGPADRVAVDSPGYANALQAVQRVARPVPVALAEEGWDLAAWARVLREAAPRLAYLIADFHNPTGRLMPEEQRERLVSLARAAGTVLVVDETMAETALHDGPLPRPVAAYDRAGGTVVAVGSAGKTFWGGLRIGWVRAAPELVRAIAAQRSSTDVASPVLEQLVVRRLLVDHLPQLLAARRPRVRAQRDALVAAVREHLPGWTFTVPDGGLSLWARTDGVSGSGLAGAADRWGVRVAAGPRFGVDGTLERFVRLPFTLPAAVLREAVVRLAGAGGSVVSGVDGEDVRVA